MAIAVITGARSGIGLATAITLARAGHTVIATTRVPGSADELSSAIAAEKLPISILALDVDDDASVDQAVQQTLAQHDRIDVLVNNAGIAGPAPVAETPLEFFRRIMETNYFGALRCIKAMLPGMLARRSGCIVNISSVAGRVAIMPQAAYASSKYALEALSECLAQEVKPFNVRVALVEPGPIATPIFHKVQQVPQATAAHPQSRKLAAVFSASMKQPTSPFVVAEQVLRIIDSDSDQLRYPVGPIAPKVFQWRGRTSDEDWVSLIAGSDRDWAAAVKRELGLDLVL